MRPRETTILRKESQTNAVLQNKANQNGETNTLPKQKMLEMECTEFVNLFPLAINDQRFTFLAGRTSGG